MNIIFIHNKVHDIVQLHTIAVQRFVTPNAS